MWDDWNAIEAAQAEADKDPDRPKRRHLRAVPDGEEPPTSTPMRIEAPGPPEGDAAPRYRVWQETSPGAWRYVWTDERPPPPPAPDPVRGLRLLARFLRLQHNPEDRS